MSEARNRGGFGRSLALAVVMIGTFMAVLDITIVNVVLPDIMASFGINIKQVKWVSTAFMIATAVVMPATGWLGRRFGLGRLYFAELALFTIGSALCAFAWNIESLVAARVVQALGAGGIMPTSMAIITANFPSAERGRALGIWGVGFMLGSAIGPTTGGYLTEWFNWRAVFSVNLPVGIIAMLVTALALEPGRKDTSSPFDFKGFLAMGSFLVAGLLTIDYGQDEGWDSQIVLFGAALAITAFLLFLVQEWDARSPMMPLRLFSSGEFRLTILISLIRSPSMFGTLFLLPLFLQNVQGRDMIDTGMLLIPSAIVLAFAMPVAGMLTDRFGPRWPTVCGFAATAYSIYLYSFIDPLTDRWFVIYPQIWRGVGIALMMTPLNTASMNAVPKEDASYASWMINLTMNVSGAVTVALLSTLLFSQTIVNLDLFGAGSNFIQPASRVLIHHAQGLGYSLSQTSVVAEALMVQQASQAATTLAFQNAYGLLTLATLLGAFPSFFLSTGRAGTPDVADES